MEKEVSPFRRRDLPSFFQSNAIGFCLFAALMFFAVFIPRYKDNTHVVILSIAFAVFGIIMSWPLAQKIRTVIEMCQKEGRQLDFEEVRATKPGKDLLTYLRSFGCVWSFWFILGLVIPELYLGDIAAHHEVLDLPQYTSPRMYRFVTLVDAGEVTLFYFYGAAVRICVPLYLWVRKLPK